MCFVKIKLVYKASSVLKCKIIQLYGKSEPHYVAITSTKC